MALDCNYKVKDFIGANLTLGLQSEPLKKMENKYQAVPSTHPASLVVLKVPSLSSPGAIRATIQRRHAVTKKLTKVTTHMSTEKGHR